jgi:sugar phosphate isomerase/epimerase
MEPMDKLSRRKFLGSTAAVAALSAVPFNYSSGITIMGEGSKKAPQGSNFGGVRIGAITYSWRSMPAGIENIIKYCKETGVTNLELMSGDLETFLGAPKNPMTGMGGGPRPAAPGAPGAGGPPAGAPQQQGQAGAQRPAGAPQGQGGGQRAARTPEQEAAIAKYNEDLKKFRLSLPLAKAQEARKLFNSNGINIHIVKFSPARWSDEEIDYAFKIAKAMGAKGVTEEISDEAVKKMAPIAAQNGMFAIFHQHMQFATTPGFSYDPFLAVSPAVMMNFDAGHFFGSTGIHPNTILEKYHDRIVSIHLKDKTGPKTEQANTNQVWGQGEAPVAEILNLIKEKKWPIHVDIELEYEVKPWSNAVKEVKTCAAYARQILM